ncbi:uncharacterized protein ATC70_002294 [Mucor velutinosus]|uniref:Chromatin modification-related protein n=1 Tax=Mucor velutinosus TaxID=708070 RepID=A0AAN7DD15_9FUNG|nr:hypothetical protein ATC70_002294 [Mucor velutinosus]
MKKDTEIMTSYLAEYSDTVEALPLELQRNYTLIRQLDESAEELLAQIAAESISLTKPQKALTTEERKKRLEHIGQLLNETLKKGEEKLALAKSTYDTVDRHCTRLDNDLQKIEDEQLIGPGRTAAVSHSTPAKRDISSLEDATPRKQTGRKKSRKTQAEKKADENAFSQEDAIQQAQAAASLSDLPIDPNEPLYCYCSQVSFGEMVACDSGDCEIEWFHLECVGLKTPPKGKWYCKNCTVDLKKKKNI